MSYNAWALRQSVRAIQPPSRRWRASYSFDNALSFRGGGVNGSMGGMGGGGSFQQIHGWPVRKTNTILNIVPQGQRMIVERFGKMHAIHDSGYFFAVPFIDDIAYVIDVRERAMDIPPQATITRDNVSVDVSGNLFVAFVDAERAAYGAANPLYAVMQHAQSAMRSAIGEMELDEILHGRQRLNTVIKTTLQAASVAWGLEIRRYEITEITPDPVIREAMDKQAAAERERREKVLQAQGDKRTAELLSEGQKIRLQNESEGDLIRIQNEAEGFRIKQMREAEGEAEALRKKAQAQADAIRCVAQELQRPGGLHAASLALARDYVSMYGEMGARSNTLMLNDRPADLNSLVAQAVMTLHAVNPELLPTLATTTNPSNGTRTHTPTTTPELLNDGTSSVSSEDSEEMSLEERASMEQKPQ